MLLWTDERVDELRRMWAEGMSSGLIAGTLGGVTRSAVIGKINRLGLQRTKTATRIRRPYRGRNSKPAPMAPVAVKAKPVPAIAVEPLPPPTPVVGQKSFAELDRYDCKFPVGDDTATMLFCGEPQAAGMPYCARCCRIAFQPRDDQRRSAHRAGGQSAGASS